MTAPPAVAAAPAWVPYLFTVPNEILLEVTDYLDNRQLSCFIQASRHLCKPLERVLYKRSAKSTNAALVWALDQMHVEVARKALEHGANPDHHVQGRGYPLQRVLDSKGHWEILNALLEKGANPNLFSSPGNPPLYSAVMSGLERETNLLLAYGADPNCESAGRPVLSLTYPMYPMAKFLRVHRALLKNGADPNGQDNDGLTALHRAASNSKLAPFVHLLLEYKADVTIQAKDGTTCFVKALKARDRSLMKRFLKADASLINAAGAKGTTPLHYAASRGMDSEVDFLIQKEANINAVNDFGETAAHQALKMNKFETAKKLVVAGIDLDIPNRSHETVFLLCMKQLVITERRTYLDLIQFMLENNQDPETCAVFRGVSPWDYDRGQAARILARKGLSGARICELLLSMKYPRL
ncbi:hypothetical protein N7468_004426 [Penicillium chermesinum]|uniref:Uncharacterized protein n=1 Tax=Penicillium chermesinum TaxID=63820 RepID=A0A9W9P8K6_9EURO|nr:uncharacterized protein N7468_004426 [Penicillium chermesinum]KAJ5239807.1 hypothetical protein N7468_004426 [Penicillium chermesinum]